MPRQEGRKMVELLDGTRFVSSVHSYKVNPDTGFTTRNSQRVHLVKTGEVWQEETPAPKQSTHTRPHGENCCCNICDPTN